MPTNPNMVAIQTVTVGAGGAASISFTSIPQTYTDLCLLLSVRSTRAGQIEDGLGVQINSSTTGYTYKVVGGDGSGLINLNTSYEQTWAGSVPGAAATSNTFSNSSVYIPNYTGSNAKSYYSDSVAENNATNGYQTMGAILQSSTSAVTSLLIKVQNGNLAEYSSITLYGVTSAGYGAKATGGIITQDNNYFYHTFLASGTFTPTQSITADYLVVAGGGSGGVGRGGGGGAGGLRCTVTATGGGGSLESALSLTAQAYTVTVGAGGAAPSSNDSRGGDGTNSVFSTITSNGGGCGGNQNFGSTDNTVIGNAGNTNRSTGFAGGSGGGSGGRGEAYNGGTGASGQGFAGGSSTGTAPGYPTGGGGGAGQAGGNAVSSTTCGNGGNGVATSISGASVTYAGGGGGAANDATTQGTGGSGGGGDGKKTGGGDNGDTNTGSGGGGGTDATNVGNTNAGAGGSGIVIVRYAK